MKLLYQLNAAFTTLLIIIISVTAFTIYSLLLNVLIQDEERQLKEKGDLLVDLLYDEPSSANVQRLSELLQDGDLQVFMFDQTQNRTLFNTVPIDVVRDWVETYDASEDSGSLWEGGGEKYVVYQTAVTSQQPGVRLVLFTPLNDLQAVQETFFGRLLVVSVIGIVVAVLLSYFLTKRLVTPLTRLKHQLKKIEKRQFNDIETIQASGEIKEVEQSVLEMAEELKHYIQSQHQFFQNASHELKTPLMTIQGYAEGIRDGVFDQNETDRGLDVVVAEIGRLKKIINEMILLAKLDSEADIYKEDSLKVEELIHQTMDRALPLASDKQVALTYHAISDVILLVDKEKMLQAMMNITSNAIRHAASRVDISVEQVGNEVSITVADDGKGVPEDIMPYLFHRFVKGNGGETGLGLAISRAIVERSGGNISVARSRFGGAAFTITI